MSSYVITEQDKLDLQSYVGLNQVGDPFYDWCQALLDKKKWSMNDMKMINQCVRDGLGALLWQLFEVKAHHRLLKRKYPHLAHERVPTMQDLMMQLAKEKGMSGVFNDQEDKELSQTSNETDARPKNGLNRRRRELELALL